LNGIVTWRIFYWDTIKVQKNVPKSDQNG